MILNKIIYDIRERLKLNSDDIDITDEYLAYLISVKRTYFIKQRFSKFTRNIPEEVKQIICVNLSPVDSVSGMSCYGTIVKSDEKIPSLIEIGGRSAIIGVRVSDILMPYLNIVPIERLPFTGYNKWLKNQIYIALDADNYLYMRADNLLHFNLEKVKVIGVFSDVEAANKMDCTSQEECDFFEMEYPIEDYIITDVVNSIVKELAPTLNIPDDKVNNSDESNRN